MEKNIHGIDKLIKTKSLFSDKYFAESHARYIFLENKKWYEEYPRIRQTEKKLEKEGKIKLPAYFSCFGVNSVGNEIHARNEEIEQKIEKDGTRTPSEKEHQAINFLVEGINQMSPSFANLYKNVYKIEYKIVTSEEILGQLKEKRGYWDKQVYLNSSLFNKSFGEIFAVLLHELCHVFGGDGRREFSDILTYLLRMAIEERQAIDAYASKWHNYQLT